MESSLDKSRMRDILEEFPNQVREASKLGQQLRITEPINKVVIAGVGGSGSVGDVVTSLLRYEHIMVTAIKEYSLPLWVNETTLVFIATYSGDTPETLSMYAEALRRKAQIVIITSGGKIRMAAMDGNTKVISVPKGMPPRLSLAYLFFPIMNILESSGLIKNYVRDAEMLLQTLAKNNYEAKAQELAMKLKNTIPIIYSGPKMAAAAQRWKIAFNENAKAHAFVSILPEAAHNEIVAYEHLTGNFHAIFLRDEKEHRNIQKQFDFMKEFLKGKGVHVTEIALKGESQLNKMFSAIHLGDWTSYFLALLHEVDPTPIRSIDELKAFVAK